MPEVVCIRQQKSGDYIGDRREARIKGKWRMIRQGTQALENRLGEVEDKDGFLKYSISMLNMGYATKIHVDRVKQACEQLGIRFRLTKNRERNRAESRGGNYSNRAPIRYSRFSYTQRGGLLGFWKCDPVEDLNCIEREA